jgi:putative phosphonate metabolism protein
MKDIKRYAIYYAPRAGAFADAAASWLGWDPVSGAEVAHPDLAADLPSLTAEPRKYGFHGTIKPPFRLAHGVDAAAADATVDALARQLQPVEMPGLDLVSLEGFLALVPKGDVTGLTDLAAQVVERLDPLRAPLTQAEIARRRPDRLTPRQRALLDQFGYPHVMEEFRFHLTLSGRLTDDQMTLLRPLAEAHFAGLRPEPFALEDLCLFGEAADGRFHLLSRYPLG